MQISIKYMDMRKIIIITLVFCNVSIKSQKNIIPNGYFENGSVSPRCSDSSYEISINFDQDIYNWRNVDNGYAYG